jgi:hypothetical protein
MKRHRVRSVSMQKLKITDLRKYLRTKDNQGLEQEILDLVKLFPNVKEYFEAKIYGENEDELLKKYEKIVRNEFFPDRGFGKLRFSVAQKAISDFKKISKIPRNVADLMVSYVEYGVEFTSTYGDVDQKFYSSIANMFVKCCEYIAANDMEDDFHERCERIMSNSQNIGWGFGDYIAEIYYNYFDIEDYEEKVE